MIFAFVLLMGKRYKLIVESEGRVLFSPKVATIAGGGAALGIIVRMKSWNFLITSKSVIDIFV